MFCVKNCAEVKFLTWHEKTKAISYLLAPFYVVMLFYAAKTIHASAKGKTNWSEPFSSLRWIKRPAERQFACCIVLADTDRYLGCGFEQKKWNSTFLPDCKPVAYILEECLSWKPVKLCQRWISALLLCHVAVFFVAPGLIAAPEEFLHLLKDACFVSFFYPHITLPFVPLILTATPTHGPVVTSSQLLSTLVGKAWIHLCVLQDCLYDQPCFFLYPYVCLFFAVHCCTHRFGCAPLSACLVAVTINNILFLHGPPETGGVVLWSVKPYTAAECC